MKKSNAVITWFYEFAVVIGIFYLIKVIR